MKKLKAYINSHVKSEFTRNVLIMFTGISFAQIIPFVISPILTRMFTPEDFGLVALFLTTSLFFGNIATFQYDQAILLPEKEEDAINLLILSFLCVSGVSIFVLLLVIFFNHPLALLMDNEAIGVWLYLVPLLVFLTGVFRILNYWTTRKKMFKRLAFRNVAQSISTSLFKIVSGLFKYSGGLIIGTLLGQFITTGILTIQTIKTDKIKWEGVSVSELKRIAKKYKDFPLISNWQGIFDMFNSTGSQYIISNIFGVKILGWYSFSVGLIQRPLQIIGASVSQVFFQKAATLYNEKKPVWPITKKIVVRLTLIGLPIFIPILFFGKPIFAFVFGENWATAGLYAQILTPWLYAKFIVSTIAIIPRVVNKIKLFFIYSLVLNILIPLCFYLIGSFYQNFELILLVTSLITFIFALLMILWIRKITIKPNY